MIKESYRIGCIRRLREYGQAFVMADQNITTLDDVVIGNVYTFICLAQRNPKDVKVVTEILGLNPQQAEIINIMEKGQAVLRLAARYPHALLVNFPLVNPEYISEEELDAINEKSCVIKNLLSKVKKRKQPEKKTEKEPDKGGVNDKVKEFLMAVNIYQYKKTLTEIYKLAGFAAGTGSRIANDCEKKNLVKIVQVKFGRGRPRYPVLLPEAYEVLGIQEKKFYGKGAGYEHILYQYLIAEHLSDYKPVIELNRNNKFIDVGIVTNELLVCIEVAMTSAHEKENIEKDISKAKADFVIVACRDKKVLKEVHAIILEMPEQFRNKTEAYLISEILSKNADEIFDTYLR